MNQPVTALAPGFSDRRLTDPAGMGEGVEYGAEQAARVRGRDRKSPGQGRSRAGSCPGLARHGEEIDFGGGGAGRRQAPARLGLGGERRHDPGFQGVAPLAALAKRPSIHGRDLGLARRAAADIADAISPLSSRTAVAGRGHLAGAEGRPAARDAPLDHDQPDLGPSQHVIGRHRAEPLPQILRRAAGAVANTKAIAGDGGNRRRMGSRGGTWLVRFAAHHRKVRLPIRGNA